MRIAVVGGGPGGLYAANLLKRMAPEHSVTVFERNGPDVAYGFGVVFSANTLRNVKTYDPETYTAMKETAASWDRIEIRHNGIPVVTEGHSFWAIKRPTLLQVLQRLARKAGVDLRFNHDVGDVESVADADLVIAADGVNSKIRTARRDAFRPRVIRSSSNFIWLGAKKEFDSFLFSFKSNEHGSFGTHCYPIGQGLSTFVVDASDQTLANAGLIPHQPLAPGESDTAAATYLEELYADELDGDELVTNGSHWQKFEQLSNERWHVDNVVLLGDAAHTAHPSVGSGTKMAMEDAIALATAVSQNPNLPTALKAYEDQRRPSVERIQRAAAAGSTWWDWFHAQMRRDTPQFVFHYLTRTPRITRDEIAVRDRRLLEDVEQWWSQEHEIPLPAVAHMPIRTPLTVGDVELRGRLVEGPPTGTYGTRDGAGRHTTTHDPSMVVLEQRRLLGGQAQAPSERLANETAALHADGIRAGLAIDLSGSLYSTRETASPLRAMLQTARAEAFDCVILDLPAITHWDAPQVLEPLLTMVSTASRTWPIAGGVWIRLGLDIRRAGTWERHLAASQSMVDAGVGLIAFGVDIAPQVEDEVRTWHVCHAADLTRELVGIPTAVASDVHNEDAALTILLSGRADLCWTQPRDSPARAPCRYDGHELGSPTGTGESRSRRS